MEASVAATRAAQEVPGPVRLFLRWLADLAVCFCCAIPFFVVGGFLGGATGQKVSDEPPAFWISIRLGLAAGACGLFYRLARARKCEGPIAGLGDKPTPGWWKLVLLAVAVIAVVDTIQTFVQRVFHLGSNEVDQMVLGAIKAGGWPLAFLILGALVVAPLGEEVLFRGLLLGRFGAYGYWRTGVVFSTLLFVVVHGSLENSPSLLAGGLMFAWLYRRTKSLWPPILLHAINNTAAFILALNGIA
jgi:membrane protease YdiL (CAAX protease family)